MAVKRWVEIDGEGVWLYEDEFHQKERAFTIEEMKACWKAAEDSLVWPATYPDKGKYFKQQFNIDL